MRYLVATELLTGRPATAISEYAEETGVEAVCVGHRGLSNENERVAILDPSRGVRSAVRAPAAGRAQL